MTKDRTQTGAGRFILEHPGVSWIVWVLMVLVISGPIASAVDLHAPRRIGVLAWITVVELFFMPATFVYLLSQRRRAAPSIFLLLSWALAQAPVLLAYASLFDRAPQWLGAPAFGEALVVMTISLRVARSDQRALANQPVQQA